MTNPYYAPFARPMGYYNPSVPMPMQEQYQPQMQPQISQMQQQTDPDMIWVLGESEASAYLVAPGRTVTMWDKNKDTAYIKSVNLQGVPTLRILDYTERMPANGARIAQETRETSAVKFVSIEAFEALRGDFEALRGELDEIKAKPKAKKAKTEELTDGE